MIRMWLKVASDFLKREHPDFPERVEREMESHMARQNALARHISDSWLDLAEARSAQRPFAKAV